MKARHGRLRIKAFVPVKLEQGHSEEAIREVIRRALAVPPHLLSAPESMLVPLKAFVVPPPRTLGPETIVALQADYWDLITRHIPGLSPKETNARQEP